MTTKWFVRFCLCLFAVIAAMHISTPAQAQSCEGVTILNESDYDLNESSICEAASPWVNKNQGLNKHGVFIFTTDEQIDSESEWMAIRDRVEIGWGIYTNTQSVTQSFAITAVVVSLTTDTNQPEGQDFGFGELLQNTPLNQNDNQERIEADMKAAVERGDINGAITRALQNAYGIAYPSVVQATATSFQPTPRPTQIPTVVPTQLPTRITGVSEDINVEEPSNPWLILLLPFVLGIILLGGYIIVKYGLPFLQSQQKYGKQITDLKSRIPRLLNKLEEVFMNNELLSLWLGSGGKIYPERTELITQYIERCKEALEVAGLKWKENRNIQPRSSADQQKLVKNLEIIYYSLVGQQREVLNMSEDDQIRLLDPVLDLPEVIEQSQLVQQLQDIEGFSQEKTLQVSKLMVDLEKMDEYGILGYIQLIKIMLKQLEKSRDIAPQLLEKVAILRANLQKEFQLPPEMVEVNVFEQIDLQIKKAQTAQQTEEWLTVQEESEKALQALEKLSRHMADFFEVLERHKENQQAWQSLHDQGYNQNRNSNVAMQEATQDIAKIIHAISAGDDALYTEYTQELISDSSYALQLLEGASELRSKNEEKLLGLAQDVAQLIRLHGDTFQSDWNQLQQYPQSNWEVVASNFEQSKQMLQSLFDNPADPNDTASEIAKLNSFEVQEFEKAEQALVKANAQMTEAEQLMEAIKHTLAEVKQLESVVTTSLSTVEEDIAKVRSRRDSNANMVDDSVDHTITEAEQLFVKAKHLAAAKEYARASDAINQIRILAHQALSAADEQIERIEHLLAGLQNVRQDIEDAFNSLKLQFNATDLSVRSDEASSLFEQAVHLYRRANQSQRTFTSQDKELQADIEQAIHQYELASQAIVATHNQLQEDANQYEAEVQQVIFAIQEAEKAIDLARNAVNKSNANGVGTHALQSAINLLPSVPPPGETYDALERRRLQAIQAEDRAYEALSLAEEEISNIERQQAANAALTTAVITSAIEGSRRRRREQSQSEPSQPRPQVKPPTSTGPIMGNVNSRSGSKPPSVGPKMGNSNTR